MDTLFDIGLYSRAEAARLTGAPSGSITRWLRGYRTSAGIEHPPMWTPDVDDPQRELTLSFRDMLDVGAVHRLRHFGLSAQLLRRAIGRASEMLGTAHPFSSAAFKTDGASLLLQIDREGEEPELVNVLTSQREMHAIIDRSLRHVEFAGMDPALWRPLGVKAGIVLDPRRSFGAPIEEETSIPTATLAQAVKAEGDPQRVAELYEISRRSVNRAVRFEDWLAQAA